MNAVVMCGGLGSRMLPLSEKTPKPMLRVLNRPVLDFLLKKLAGEGFTDIYLTLGYRAEEIISFLEGRDYGARIVCRTEEKPLGTAGGVKNALQDAPGDFLVLSGDNLFDFSLDALREAHYLSGHPVTIVGTEASDPRDYGVIVTDREGCVTGFTEKPDWEDVRSFFVNTGIYFCSGDVLGMIPDGEPVDLAKDLFPRLLREGRRIGAVKAEGNWYDIGSIPEYRETNAALLKDPANAEPEAGVYYGFDTTDEEGNRFVAPCFLGRRVRLGGGVTVGPFCCVGDGTELGRDCVVTNSVVGEDCVIGSGSDVNGAVLADSVTAKENVLLEEGSVVGYGARIGRFSRVFPGVKISAGLRVPPESLVSGDLRDQSGVSAAFDLYGMSGRVHAGITLTDALKIGQALAGSCGRIGFGCDGDPVSELYLGACQCGAAACGAEAYDFGTVFRGQICFYSYHCALNAFVFVSCKDGEVSFRFAGEGGLPFPKAQRRKITDGYRYGSFSFAEPGKTGRRFRMELFSSVYKSRLKKVFASFRQSVELSVESSNRCLSETVGDVLQYGDLKEPLTRIMCITDGGAGEAYVAEDDKVFYASAVLLFLCEYEFAQGGDVAVPEEAPALLEAKAALFGRKVFRVGPDMEAPPDKALVFRCLWAFDSVFLAFRVCELIARSGMKLAELLKDVESVSVRKNVCVFDCEPAKLNRALEAVFGARAAGESAYRADGPRSSARVRQLGNTSRVRILAESAEMEAAKELTAEITEKIHAAIIDNTDKIE